MGLLETIGVILEIVVVLLKVVYFWCEAIVLSLIPAGMRGKDVSGETVLITGAGSGIGRLLAKRFAERGCRLVLWDVNTKGNEETATYVKKFGSVVKTYTVDLSDRIQIYKTAAKVKDDIGDIDILVNNAGIVTGKKFLECPDNMIEKTMQVNAHAHFWTVKAFLPSMLERNHGHIVNIASIAGITAAAGMADYSASKFAAVGFNEALHNELLLTDKKGVRTTVVCPYLIGTGMFAGCKSRFNSFLPELNPDDVADAIMNGILCNNHMVLIPKSLSIFVALKGVIPVKVADVISSFIGANSMMDTFRGRQKTH